MSGSSFFLWPETALSVGGCSIVSSHFNYMLQMSLALSGRIRTRVCGAAEWSDGELTLIGPNRSSEYDFSDCVAITLYVDIEAQEHLRQAELLTSGARCEAILKERDDAEIGKLRRAAARMKDGCPEDAARLRDELLSFSRNRFKRADRPFSASQNPTDHRLARVKAYIVAHLEDRISVHVLAAIAGLSAGRLMVLFRRHFGLTIRHFILWARMKAALRAAAAGSPVTKAAIVGGFYDAAHFARSFKLMFGVGPTALFERKSRRIHLCDGI